MNHVRYCALQFYKNIGSMMVTLGKLILFTNAEVTGLPQ